VQERHGCVIAAPGAREERAVGCPERRVPVVAETRLAERHDGFACFALGPKALSTRDQRLLDGVERFNVGGTAGAHRLLECSTSEPRAKFFAIGREVAVPSGLAELREIAPGGASRPPCRQADNRIASDTGAGVVAIRVVKLRHMTKEELIAGVKQAVALAKEMKVDAMYDAYIAVFANPGFAKNRAEDQRQALKLMVQFKGAPKPPSPRMTAAHQAALGPLTDLVALHSEPSDFEMLGLCHLRLGRSDDASTMFREGLKIERERNPSSDLCGVLMRRISEI